MARRKPACEHTRRAFVAAHELAERLRQKYIGPSHLLYGIARIPQDPACDVLLQAGVQVGELEAAIRRLAAERTEGDPRLTPRAREVLGLASEEADARREHLVRPIHVLIALVQRVTDDVAEVLARIGVSESEILDLARATLDQGTNQTSGQSPRLRLLEDPRCPQHNVVLDVRFIAGITIHRCPECGGQFVSRANIRRLYDLIGVRTPTKLTSPPADGIPSPGSIVRCPQDRVEMQPARYKRVTVRVCPTCLGVWLGEGQLEIIWAKYEPGGGVLATPVQGEPEPVTARDVVDVLREAVGLVEDTMLELADWIFAFRRRE